MASPSIPTALRHQHLPTGRRILLHSAGEPCPRSTLPFRLGGLSLRKGHIGAGTVSATRSPGLGNAENLRESSSLSRSWDLIGQIGDDHDVLIECRDVHKSFGDKQVLKGVSFKIRHGEAVGIMGPLGTGKSTILKVMAGLPAPDMGDVIILRTKKTWLS